jgi:hypothetical protein
MSRLDVCVTRPLSQLNTSIIDQRSSQSPLLFALYNNNKNKNKKNKKIKNWNKKSDRFERISSLHALAPSVNPFLFSFVSHFLITSRWSRSFYQFLIRHRLARNLFSLPSFVFYSCLFWILFKKVTCVYFIVDFLFIFSRFQFFPLMWRFIVKVFNHDAIYDFVVWF